MSTLCPFLSIIVPVYNVDLPGRMFEFPDQHTYHFKGDHFDR